MTNTELRAAWLRWMHRNDVAADLPVVEAMASERIGNRIMRGAETVPTVEEAPALWLHAGLIYLHELAQDDEGGARETALFEQAVQDEHFRWSIDHVVPDPLLPAGARSPGDAWDTGASSWNANPAISATTEE